MKLLLVLLPLLLIAGAVANQATETNEQENAIVELPPVPANHYENLQHAKNALEVVEKIVDIFNSDIFEKSGIKKVAEILTKSLSLIGAILNLIMGIIGQEESAEMKFMREQFAEVNAKLDGISLQLDDVKKLIDWNTARVMYAGFEISIVTASKLFDDYVAAPRHEQERRLAIFMDNYKPKQQAAFKLYQAIVDTNFVISDNLAAAVVHFTANHQRKVRNFLLAMSRLILRGSQLDIAYAKFKDGDAAANMIQSDWANRMEKLATKMKQVDDQVRNVWFRQMELDFERIILEKRDVSHNGDFSGIMYNFLADKYDWRNWFSLAYGAVTGYHLHTISVCGGYHRFRQLGNRNVVAASADRETSRFTMADGDRALDEAQSARHGTNDASVWFHEIDRRIAGGCDHAAFRGAICWGCNVWWTAHRDSFSYRKIDAGGGHVNAIIFG